MSVFLDLDEHSPRGGCIVFLRIAFRCVLLDSGMVDYDPDALWKILFKRWPDRKAEMVRLRCRGLMHSEIASRLCVGKNAPSMAWQQFIRWTQQPAIQRELRSVVAGWENAERWRPRFEENILA